MARPSSTDRLVRLLALPAWVAEHDGATFEQAAAHFGVSPRTIRTDVYTLWVSGLPGGMPADLVDFDAAAFEHGRLRLTQPLGLDRPVRLSRQEAISLLMSLRVLDQVLSADPVSRRALAGAQTALRTALGGTGEGPHEAPQEDETSAAKPQAAGPPGLEAAVLDAVRRALAERHRLHLVYVSATDTRSEREVDPLELVSDGSHLTLRAWCLSARAERSFRLDRVLEARVLPVGATAHRAARHHLPAQDLTATLTLAPSGRWLVEQVPCLGVEEHPDGTMTAVIQGRDRAWLVGLVLSAGRHLRRVDPPDLAREAAAAARRALAADAVVHAGRAPQAQG